MARRSMQTQMAGIQTTGQNIANVNTAGYTRQRAIITEALAVNTAGLGNIGTGSQVTRIEQVMSELLNRQVRSSNSDLGFQEGRQSALQSAQAALAEFLTNGTDGTNGSGLSTQLNDLFSAFQAVAASPNSPSALQTLIGAAQTLTTSFNQISNNLSGIRTGLNSSISDDVTAANGYLAQIADLNAQIYSVEVSGGTANDLRDQRGLALENLAKLADISTSTDAQGQFNVSLGGQALVTGRNLTDTLQTYDAGGGQLLLRTTTGATNLTLGGGSIQGTIEARDNTLATLQTNLDSLASNLISAVNTVHSSGFSASGTTGANFFTGTNASTISVNAALVNNPSLLQTSGSATASGDNSVALQLAQFASAAQAGLGGQSFTDFYSSLVAQFGAAVNDADTQVNLQQTVNEMFTTQRASVSGVNLDEEMTNLITFQRAYQASAEVLKTVDEMIQVTLGLKR